MHQTAVFDQTTRANLFLLTDDKKDFADFPEIKKSSQIHPSKNESSWNVWKTWLQKIVSDAQTSLRLMSKIYNPRYS